MCFLYIQMLYLSYIHCVHPHSESIYNKLEFVNEYCMVLLAYAMLNFTQIGTIQDPETLEPMVMSDKVNMAVEWGAVGLIIFMAVTNFVVMIKVSISKVILKFKASKQKKKLALS